MNYFPPLKIEFIKIKIEIFESFQNVLIKFKYYYDEYRQNLDKYNIIYYFILLIFL